MTPATLFTGPIWSACTGDLDALAVVDGRVVATGEAARAWAASARCSGGRGRRRVRMSSSAQRRLIAVGRVAWSTSQVSSSEASEGSAAIWTAMP